MEDLNSAIVGIGATEYSSDSGRSVFSLALEASKGAIEDAGLSADDIDGILTFNVGDSVSTESVATGLGLPQVNYALDWYMGGIAPPPLVLLASLLVKSGTCKCVLIFRALNGRSGFRLGGEDQLDAMIKFRGVASEFRYPYGWLAYAHNMAMWCRRHMVEYGTKPEHLGAIAVCQRENALLNERATMKKPLTLDQYMNAPTIAEPFRVYDMCLETDGGCSLVVTSSDRAKDCRKAPVYIKAAGYSGRWGGGLDWADSFLWEDITENFTHQLAGRLYREAGMGPEDIDVAEIYDCFTHTVLLGLEGLGFCKKGEGGAFAASGAIKRDGSIPVNTGGGMLSEAYLHGMNPITEAVLQLRNEAGNHQVPNAETAIVTSGATTFGGGLILCSEGAR